MKKIEVKHFLEVVIFSDSEFDEDWKKNPNLKKNIDSYLKASEAFLKARYGDFNITRDENCKEKTPHFHVFIAPICVDKNNNKETYNE
jgi:hypothetical protein